MKEIQVSTHSINHQAARNHALHTAGTFCICAERRGFVNTSFCSIPGEETTSNVCFSCYRNT